VSATRPAAPVALTEVATDVGTKVATDVGATVAAAAGTLVGTDVLAISGRETGPGVFVAAAPAGFAVGALVAVSGVDLPAAATIVGSAVGAGCARPSVAVACGRAVGRCVGAAVATGVAANPGDTMSGVGSTDVDVDVQPNDRPSGVSRANTTPIPMSSSDATHSHPSGTPPPRRSEGGDRLG
jgi:hypothetical protein